MRAYVVVVDVGVDVSVHAFLYLRGCEHMCMLPEHSPGICAYMHVYMYMFVYFNVYTSVCLCVCVSVCGADQQPAQSLCPERGKSAV